VSESPQPAAGFLPSRMLPVVEQATNNCSSGLVEEGTARQKPTYVAMYTHSTPHFRLWNPSLDAGKSVAVWCQGKEPTNEIK
jgi:hypothetical protein